MVQAHEAYPSQFNPPQPHEALPVTDQDLQLGREFLLQIFGEAIVDDLYNLTAFQMFQAVPQVIEALKGLDREVSSEQLSLESKFVLIIFANESNDEIATRLGVEVGAINQMMSSIAGRIRDNLDPQNKADLITKILEAPTSPALNTASHLGNTALKQGETSEDRGDFATKAPIGERRRKALTRPTTTTKRRKSNDDLEDSVRQYLNEIGKFPLMTKEDEADRAQLMEEGLQAANKLAAAQAEGRQLAPQERRRLERIRRRGEAAKDEFIERNLRLVVSIAKKYQSSGLPLLDIIQEGNLGLEHAVDKFDWRKGFKFSTYATWWIKQSIQRGIANTNRIIRLPVHASDTEIKINIASSRLEIQLGRPPTVEEISVEIGIPIAKIQQIKNMTKEPVSLSEKVGPDGDLELGDILEDRTALDPSDLASMATLQGKMMDALGVLEDREREIVKLRFGLETGEPKTLEEVGEVFGLTRERIRQIEARVMSKLRHPSADLQELREFLPY